MPWSLWAPPPAQNGRGEDDKAVHQPQRQTTTPAPSPVDHQPHHSAVAVPATVPLPANVKPRVSWDDSLNRIDWHHYKENWVPPVLLTTFVFGIWAFYRSYLRRIPGTDYIKPSAFRSRTLLGKVTSVGDGDNFHLFHTPGGRLAGWGWLRRVPTARKDLKGRTIPVRIAGVDAPEGAHFGKTAQPFSGEALSFLRSFILGKRVRAHIYKRDQYDRVVASVFVRKAPFFLRKDVGLEMLKRGMATTYEAKTGAEFGGKKMEAVYKAAEATAKSKGRGMWSGEKGGFFGMRKEPPLESPRDFKTRMKALDKDGPMKKSKH
ncbi:nuclease domain-containing protein [Podospora didyma]|uniref:Probable endonuclease LCL3 n=1 Tax=Podospora didyma TaxID=330526 RepID=A0AAE0P4H3_9PEZI|nr:nuclease domain-containing protein [Podospora didyma]